MLGCTKVISDQKACGIRVFISFETAISKDRYAVILLD
jgi:hypothetical protein